MDPISHRPAQDGGHWRDRAERARAVATRVHDAETKRILLEIAERYEEIARITDAS